MSKERIRVAIVFTIYIFAWLAVMLWHSQVRAQTTLAPLSIFSDATQQHSSSILVVPTYTDALVLVAGASQTQAVPAFAKWVIFSAACNFFAKAGASAAVPGASTTNGSAAMQNPSAWNVQTITQITVISAANCIVTLSFYQ